jgi:hypothetical protein
MAVLTLSTATDATSLANNRIALQAACNDTTVPLIEFEEGTFNFDRPIKVNRTVAWRGKNRRATILKCPSWSGDFVVGGFRDVAIPSTDLPDVTSLLDGSLGRTIIGRRTGPINNGTSRIALFEGTIFDCGYHCGYATFDYLNVGICYIQNAVQSGEQRFSLWGGTTMAWDNGRTMATLRPQPMEWTVTDTALTVDLQLVNTSTGVVSFTQLSCALPQNIGAVKRINAQFRFSTGEKAIWINKTKVSVSGTIPSGSALNVDEVAPFMFGGTNVSAASTAPFEFGGKIGDFTLCGLRVGRTNRYDMTLANGTTITRVDAGAVTDKALFFTDTNFDLDLAGYLDLQAPIDTYDRALVLKTRIIGNFQVPFDGAGRWVDPYEHRLAGTWLTKFSVKDIGFTMPATGFGNAFWFWQTVGCRLEHLTFSGHMASSIRFGAGPYFNYENYLGVLEVVGGDVPIQYRGVFDTVLEHVKVEGAGRNVLRAADSELHVHRLHWPGFYDQPISANWPANVQMPRVVDGHRSACYSDRMLLDLEVPYPAATDCIMRLSPGAQTEFPSGGAMESDFDFFDHAPAGRRTLKLMDTPGRAPWKAKAVIGRNTTFNLAADAGPAIVAESQWEVMVTTSNPIPAGVDVVDPASTGSYTHATSVRPSTVPGPPTGPGHRYPMGMGV